MSEQVHPPAQESPTPEPEHDPRFTDELVDTLKGTAHLAGDTVHITGYAHTEPVKDSVKHYIQYEDQNGETKLTTLDQFLWMDLPAARQQELRDAGIDPYDMVAGTDPILHKHPTGTESQPKDEPSESSTEEMPTRKQAPGNGDSFTYHEAKFKRLDPDKDTFSQLEQKAAEQGNPEMVGLEWIEADGLRYRISSHEKLTRVNHKMKKTRLPRFSHHKVNGPALSRKEIPEPVTEEVDYRTVDVLNANGDVVDILTFVGYQREWIPTDNIGGILLERATGIPQGEYKDKDGRDNFENHFYVGAHINPASPGAQIKVPRKILGFQWAEQQESEIVARGMVAAPEIADWSAKARREPERPKEMKPKSPEQKTQELFEALAEQQVDLGLSDWRGLTWSTPFPRIDKETRSWNRYNTPQMQIIRDMIVIRNAEDPDNSYPERLLEVRTQSPDGTTTNRHIYTLAELMKQFSRRETREREVHRLRTTGVKLPSGVDWLVLSALYERLGDIDERGADLNLRWETPEPPVEPKTPKDPAKHQQKEQNYAWQEYWKQELRWRDPGSIPEEALRNYMPSDEVYEMLVYPEHYPDTPGGKAALQEHIDRLKKAPHGRELASRLEMALVQQDLSNGRFIEMVSELRDGYMTDLRRLGIEIPEAHDQRKKENSYTWIIHDMDKLLARGIGNPFENSVEGHKLRTRIINLRLGHRFKAAAVQLIEKPSGKRSRGEEDEDSVKGIVRLVNPKIKYRIRELLYKKDIENILGESEELEGPPRTNSAEELAEQEKLGKLIRLSLGEV